MLADKIKNENCDECDNHFAHDDVGVAFRIETFEIGDKRLDIADWVHDQKKDKC